MVRLDAAAKLDHLAHGYVRNAYNGDTALPIALIQIIMNFLKFIHRYENSGPIVPKEGSAPLTYIDITDCIHISMDIKIKRFSHGWTNIFLIGSDLNRQPGIWINHASQSRLGFHISFYNGSSNPTFDTGGALEVNKVYHVDIYYDKSGVKVTANNETTSYPGNKSFPNYPQHLFQNFQPVYIGQPDHYPSSNVKVTNLTISYS